MAHKSCHPRRSRRHESYGCFTSCDFNWQSTGALKKNNNNNKSNDMRVHIYMPKRLSFFFLVCFLMLVQRPLLKDTRLCATPGNATDKQHTSEWNSKIFVCIDALYLAIFSAAIICRALTRWRRTAAYVDYIDVCRTAAVGSGAAMTLRQLRVSQKKRRGGKKSL